ncbi:cytosol aminopeptidase-like isoform X2 [Sitodiplosis mosellana]|uniref:cytosol aminopeptidase-like isoform X2 n=1 Tax=Sitodiplosis mosellana TaxID=263140 RepID=UPI00244535AC|nr:cytosol aminopeptidase-like isoform X2 [Sitodiplosis mosellana]XP_055317164.1 cytosol aminopeptidase-like isoform X2 [Sitodiplosis mosellana]
MAIFRSFAFKYSSVVYRNRLFSSMTDSRGLVLGVYSDEKTKSNKLTKAAEKYNAQTNGQLLQLIDLAGPISNGSQRTFWGLGGYTAVSVVGLGDGAKDWDALEKIDGEKENVRIAAGVGVKALAANKIFNIELDDLESAQSAAEGAHLASYIYQEFRAADKQKKIPELQVLSDSSKKDEWNFGKVLANSQNWARTLSNTPANHMTPTLFAENVAKNMAKGVEVVAHDRQWAEQQGMGSFLSVSNGSAQPPIFLELTYRGIDSAENPIALVGKGITFDSGGISIKPSAKMDAMRADMSGGAIVAATINALAETGAKVYVKGFIPLTENMPGGRATKPGDVFKSRNGKTICVDNTDAEGRLVLIDALDYAADFKPQFILDIATLTGAMSVALGDCLTGAFVNNDKLWQHLEKASESSGDRLWRMPLLKHYTKQMTDFSAYDLDNIAKSGKGGGSCTAAAFLREFVPKDTPWVHLDIAPVMGDTSDQSYLGEGMCGRPLRTIYELIAQNYQRK